MPQLRALLLQIQISQSGMHKIYIDKYRLKIKIKSGFYLKQVCEFLIVIDFLRILFIDRGTLYRSGIYDATSDWLRCFEEVRARNAFELFTKCFQG